MTNNPTDSLITVVTLYDTTNKKSVLCKPIDNYKTLDKCGLVVVTEEHRGLPLGCSQIRTTEMVCGVTGTHVLAEVDVDNADKLTDGVVITNVLTTDNILHATMGMTNKTTSDAMGIFLKDNEIPDDHRWIVYFLYRPV